MFVVPGFVIDMTPPYMHMSLQELLSAGLPPMSTVGDPGVQGAVHTGMHGMGVSVPMAAAVAAATVGLVMDLHMPNGMILTIGILSMMEASAILDMTLAAGSTLSVDGAIPKLHVIIAPPHTANPISTLLLVYAQSLTRS